MKIEDNPSLSIYIHIPFCKQKCLYCDFLSAPATVQTREEYVKALLYEIKKESPKYASFVVTTIFLGGGTPSLLSGEQIGRILKAVYRHYRVEQGAEITIECNPATASLQKLRSFYKNGINRISIGLQSADDKELAQLGRIHTFSEFCKTYEAARKAGFTNINVDLMAALPGQTLQSYKNTLEKVTALQPEHVSAYSLIIEEGTPFYERYGIGKNGEYPPLPDEDTERRMYDKTEKFLREKGYERYEISNYAKKGYECRHNLTYWTGKAYVGFGIGAASYVNDTRYKNTDDLTEYMEFYRGQYDADKICREKHVLNRQEKMEEFMFIGLRLKKGISRKEFVRQFGCELESVYGTVLEEMKKNKLLCEKGNRICLTKRGTDISNYVMAQFLLS